MRERDRKSPDDDRSGEPDQDRDAIIPGRHGKHGGSLESEGSPQEPTPDAHWPPKRNGDDRNRH